MRSASILSVFEIFGEPPANQDALFPSPDRENRTVVRLRYFDFYSYTFPV